MISSDKIEVDKTKVNLSTNISLSTCVKNLRPFLGHVGFYRRFIKDFSKVAKHLSSLLTKDMSFNFSKECEFAFNTLKEALIMARILQPPVWEGHLYLCVMH